MEEEEVGLKGGEERKKEEWGRRAAGRWTMRDREGKYMSEKTQRFSSATEPESI